MDTPGSGLFESSSSHGEPFFQQHHPSHRPEGEAEVMVCLAFGYRGHSLLPSVQIRIRTQRPDDLILYQEVERSPDLAAVTLRDRIEDILDQSGSGWRNLTSELRLTASMLPVLRGLLERAAAEGAEALSALLEGGIEMPADPFRYAGQFPAESSDPELKLLVGRYDSLIEPGGMIEIWGQNQKRNLCLLWKLDPEDPEADFIGKLHRLTADGEQSGGLLALLGGMRNGNLQHGLRLLIGQAIEARQSQAASG